MTRGCHEHYEDLQKQDICADYNLTERISDTLPLRRVWLFRQANPCVDDSNEKYNIEDDAAEREAVKRIAK
jgi:hypothetical protein